MSNKIKTNKHEKLTPIQEMKIKKRAEKLFTQLCIDNKMVPVAKYSKVVSQCRKKFTNGFVFGATVASCLLMIFWMYANGKV